jgi:hypothetical protein
MRINTKLLKCVYKMDFELIDHTTDTLEDILEQLVNLRDSKSTKPSIRKQLIYVVDIVYKIIVPDKSKYIMGLGQVMILPENKNICPAVD